VTGTAAVPPQLFQRWVHVREEDEPGVMVYRPASAPLPPARGRDGVEFRPDGSMVAFSPGPVDVPVARTGAWHVVGGGGLSISSPAGEHQFQILTVNEDVLRLRPAR